MTGLVDDAQAIVDELTAANIRATVDPAQADTNRPCVLVAPPTLDWTAGNLAGDPGKAWRLVCLSSYATAGLPSFAELDDLVTKVAAIAHVETAEPVGYVLTPATGPVPAYVIRITT